MKSSKRSYSRDQFLALLGAALLQLALAGTLLNTIGVLLAQIRTEYGFQLSRITTFNLIRTLAGALLASAYSAAFFKLGKGKTIMGCIGLIVAGHLLLFFGPDTWVWYLSPVLMSCGSSICIFGIPYALRPWFPEGDGTASGLAMAFSGIGGMVFSPIIAALISSYGWRVSVQIMSLLTLAFGAIGTFLLFSKKLPLSHSEEIRSKNSENDTGFDLGKFLLAAVLFVGNQFAMLLVSYLSIYAQDFGYSLVSGAALTSFVMAGNILGKLVYGVGCDRLGMWKTTFGCYLLVAAGVALMVVMVHVYPILCMGAVMMGFVYAVNTLAVAKCCIAIYGETASSRYVGLHAGVNAGFGTLLSLGIGIFYDYAGTFVPIFLAAAASAAVSSFIAFIMMRRSGRPG